MGGFKLKSKELSAKANMIAYLPSHSITHKYEVTISEFHFHLFISLLVLFDLWNVSAKEEEHLVHHSLKVKEKGSKEQSKRANQQTTIN